MTAHKSKGLEFEYVFMVKCIDGKWGNTNKKRHLSLPPNVLQEQKLGEMLANEDERRLFYVAMTRAKKKLTISYAGTYPLQDKAACIPSQFLGEIAPEHSTREDAHPFEEQTHAVFELLFAEHVRDVAEEERDFLKKLVTNYRLNPVAMSTYLNCPQLFAYTHLVKVPQVKEKMQIYGTIMHAALEQFFLAFRKDNHAPSREWLLDQFRQILQQELVAEDVRAELLKEGTAVLAAYYDFYADRFIPPLYIERDYNRIPIHFDGIPLSGKIDKVEHIDATTVRVVDYKTGRPKSENDIKGLTAKADKGYFYQLQFYKLLLELDRDVDKVVTSGMLDFVYADKDKTEFKQLEITFLPGEYEEFKLILKDVYQKIQNLEFPKTADRRRCESCAFRTICHKDTLF